MEIQPFVSSFAQDVARSAAALGPEAVELADRLAPLVDNTLRLVLLEALSQAAAEITTELPGYNVEVRLRGRDPELVVAGGDTSTEPLPLEAGPATSVRAATAPGSEGEESSARITLRLPDSLKARAEQLASERGQSLNTWIVGAMRLATLPGVADADGFFAPGAPGRNRSSNRRVQGWVR